MNNIFNRLQQEIISDDGTYKIFILHKALHLFFGFLAAIITIYLTDNSLAGLIAAFMLGLGRESAKQTGMLLHIVTLLITTAGFFIAYWLLV